MTDEALIERIARAVWNCNFHPDDVASGEADRRIADWPEDWAKSERQARAILPFIHADRIEAQAAALQAKEDGLKVRDNRIAKLEGALRDISAECGECGGYGTYPAEETVTGKVLWWDCSSPACKAARAALEQDQ